jgi:outer membrane protein assembly factor BamE
MAGLSHSTCRPSIRAAIRAATVLGVAACAGCSLLPERYRGGTDTFLGFITPYRIEIVQGNVVTREQAALVKPGMTRAQVRDILGTPMLADPFHADRWDYVFTLRRQGAEPQRRSVVAFFKDDTLERLEASDLPSEREFVASIDPPSGSSKTPVLELTPEQRAALPRATPPPSPPSEPMGAVRSYPPLEPSS